MPHVTTPGADDANAYAEVADALVVAPFRGAAGAVFGALDPDQQEAALQAVALDIDATLFAGAPTYTTQSMAFPRDGDTTIPAKIARANIEEAIVRASLFATGATGNPFDASGGVDGGIKRKKVDVLETEWFEPRSVTAGSLRRFSLLVQNLLHGFLYVEYSGYGSANVVRTS